MATAGDDLVNVQEELKPIFTELFLGEDSEDEFEGFYPEDIDSSSNSDSDSSLGHWDTGDREPTPLNFTGSRGLKLQLPDNPDVIYRLC